MIEEKFLKSAIEIRRKYLKTIGNYDLIKKRGEELTQTLSNTLEKIGQLEKEIKESKSKKTNKKITEEEAIGRLQKILIEIEVEGEKLSKMTEPLNEEIENLRKEEKNLYDALVDKYPDKSQEQLVNEIQDRIKKEGL